MKEILVCGLSPVYGGAESIALGLMKYMTTQGYRFSYLRAFDGDIRYQVRLDEMQISVYDVTPWGENRAKYQKEVSLLLARKQFDFVWFHTTNAVNTELLLAVQSFQKTKMIVHCHGSGIEAKPEWKHKILEILHHIKRNSFNRMIDIKLSCSDKATKWLFGHDENVTVIKNGIETQQYLWDQKKRNELRSALNVENKHVWMHIGRLAKVKNHEFLLNLFKQYHTQNPDAYLILIGEGEEHNAILNNIQQLGLEAHVSMLGFRSDISDLLLVADLLLLPSKSEGLPVVLIEAQITHLPCVVSSVVTKELKINDNILYASINSIPEWLARIVSLAMSKRENCQESIIEHGFDVAASAAELVRVLTKE